MVRLRTQLDAADQFLTNVQYARAMMSDFGVVDPEEGSALVATAAFFKLARERFVSGAATGPRRHFLHKVPSPWPRSALISAPPLPVLRNVLRPGLSA